MSDNGSASPEADAAARTRRSGRVVKAPQKFADDAALSTAGPKRKRDQNDDDDPDSDAQDSDDAMSDDAAESDDPDATPKARKPTASSRAKKSSIKKPKTNGAQSSRGGQFGGLPSRPKKSVRIEAGEKGTGLFAEVFGSGDSSDSVARDWLEKYRADNAVALTDLVNCILQCIGCEHEVTEDDIRDEENIPNRLHDLQNVYQEQQATEYPLISKSKNTRSFRDLLVRFFRSLVHLLHETDVLYNDNELIDSVQAWLASMSSAGLRPFRHTATTISLALQSGLVDVADILDRRIASTEQQLQSAKRAKNKTKATEIQRNVVEANKNRKYCAETIQSFFDVIFVHRYRDIEPKIRAECVEALGHWIWTLPTVFLEPGYLRYLGWMLSDTNAVVRQEVLRQLHKLFKRDAQQLGHFLDRFRPRLIEIATLDAEISVRVAAIAVIDTLRASALLEPLEIDAIGILIFDDEIRIRKAVVGFFVACVDDALEGKVEEMGGNDVLEEFDNVDEDIFDTPRREWANIKCLAETLAIYDAQIQEKQRDEPPASIDIAVDLLELRAPETNIARAAAVLYDRVPEIRKWEILSGYLLYDHTTSSKSRAKSKGGSSEAAFKKAVAPSNAEEIMLLSVLSAAVKLSLTQASEVEKGKKKGHRVDASEPQEETALELASTIPKLLNKFGAAPETAAIVLRLEHCLDLDVFQQLRQDSSKYAKMLDEVATQFSRHDDNSVLSEAAAALLHARKYEELEEVVDSKVATLWENCITALRNSDASCELFARGNLAEAPLRDLTTVLMKMSKLVTISNCTDTLEAEGGTGASDASAISIVANIVHRGKYEPQDDEDIDDLEDELVSFAIKTCQFYFMWKVRDLSDLITNGRSVSDAQLDALAVLRQTYRRHLIETFSSRALIDQLRLYSTGCLCDLHIMFGTLRYAIQRYQSSKENGSGTKFKSLVQEIEPGLVPELLSIFDGAEKQYAKKARKDKTLNEPAEDEDPIADDEDESDDDDDEDLTAEDRYIAEVKAEKAMCELAGKYVNCINNRLLDFRGPQAGKLRLRLLRNQAKLGNNYKAMVAYLDETKRTARKHPSTKPVLPIKPRTRTPEPADEDVFEEEAAPEEGSREDLRRRELLEDDPIDDDSEGEDAAAANNDMDDDVIGD
ncbi:STAG-domain-containing protein [Sarocladium strictum]